MGLDKRKEKIPLFLLFKVFWRSFFIQALWNSERLLGFGLAYTMFPVIRYLYPVRTKLLKTNAQPLAGTSNGVNKNKEERKLIMKEYLTFFNTHPYLASPIIGLLISEEERNKGIAQPNREKIQNLKIQIMGPLGALGDTFFWATLRPFAALLGVSFVFLFWDKNKFVALIGAFFCFFCFYNFFHLLVRFVGILRGYHLGLQIATTLKKIDLQNFSKILSGLGLIIIGIGLVIFPFSCSLFNLGELLSLGYIINFFVVLIIFTIISLLLSMVTPAKIILLLILFGEFLAFMSFG